MKKIFSLKTLLLFALFLVCSEGFLRATGHFDTFYHYVYNENLLLRKPHAYYFHKKENENIVRYNNLGFHDYDRDGKSSSFRFLVLGDSFVEGAQIPKNKLFTSILEEKFKANNMNVEVINAGVSGSNTAYQYILWRDFLSKKVSYDHLILCFYLGDDLYQNNYELNKKYLNRIPENYFAYIDPDNDEVYVVKVQSSLLRRVFKKLASHSVLIHWLQYKLYEVRQIILKKKLKNGDNGREDSFSVLITVTVKSTQNLIVRWAKELALENKGFTVVFFPKAAALSEGYRAPHETILLKNSLKGALHELDVGVFSITFDYQKPQDVYSFDGDSIGHFNFDAHQIVAEQLLHPLTSSLKTESGLK